VEVVAMDGFTDFKTATAKQRSGLVVLVRSRTAVALAPPRAASAFRLVAAGAGYFDQAHFGHEFRAFTGL
jgi:hypothetical protein